jgi:hypothetical protein
LSLSPRPSIISCKKVKGVRSITIAQADLSG